MRFAVLTIAEKLGKYPHEIEEDLTVSDVAEWIAFVKIQNDQQEDAIKKSKRKASTKAKQQSSRPSFPKGGKRR